MDGPEANEALYGQFARLAKAVAHPKRIEILDVLAQGERSVERLAAATGMGMTNTSAQLQVLRQARLVESRKDGPRVLYRLADDQVAGFVAGLQDLARARLAEVDRVARDYFEDPAALEPVTRAGLMDRAQQGEVVILDVRPAEEFAAGHIPGAISTPWETSTAPSPGSPGTGRSSPTAGARTACSPPRPSSCSAGGAFGPGGWRTACRNGAGRVCPSPSERSER